MLALVLMIAFPSLAQPPASGSIQPVDQPLTVSEQEAAKELNEAAWAYRQGRFAEAQLHAEKALAIDPSSQTAARFIARTVHAQYKPGDESDANLAKAREAVDAYRRLLERDSHNEEAYQAIAYFYSVLKEDELLHEWVFRRAVDATFSDEQRAEAYLVLASRDWDCSFKITELPSNKVTVLTRKNRMEIHYKPKEPAEFSKALRCATEGLELNEAAIAMDPDSDVAWQYKENLLLELAKLSEMDNDLQLKAEYSNQAKTARQTSEELKRRKINGATNVDSPIGSGRIPGAGFEADLQYVRNGKYAHVWIFSRKDGKKLDKNDATYLRTNAPRVTDWVATSEGLKIIAGSNFDLEPGNWELLKQRFNVEDYSSR